MGNSKTDKNIIKSLNPLKFFSIVKERSQRFKNAPEIPLVEEYSINALAKKLHPSVQHVKVADIQELADGCKRFTLIPDYQNGTSELAYFSSGQYVTVFLNIDGLKLTRAYSISSSPDESLFKNKENPGFYQITVKPAKDGLVSAYILENWKVGLPVEISAPEGTFSYVYLRDAPTVIGIAGGSGITPFLSMARSIANGSEDFNLILLYGSRNESSILFKDEFSMLEKESEKIKVIHVLGEQQSDSEKSFEHGFVTSDLIKKYAPKTDYSVFVCGPQEMYRFIDKELEKLNLEKKFIRHEMFGEIHGASKQKGCPETKSSEITIKVTICDEEKTVQGNSEDTILQILEKGGVQVPNRCRSGECGWCHSLLKSGKIFVPTEMDYRRKADLKYNFIHPCCTFALSDLELDIPPAK